MKKCICITLCMVLLFSISSTAIANDTLELEAVETVKRVKPIAYTNDFAAYGNVVGVLNSDGTKTAYLFASAEDAKQIDAITGLVSPGVTPPDVQVQETGSAQPRGSDSSFAIVDAPVYSNRSQNNYANSSSMIIGGSDTYGYCRTYVKFELSALYAENVAYTDILSASLNFTEATTIEGDNRAATIQAYLVKESWNVSTVTWNNRPDYYNEMIGCTNAGFNQSYENITINPSKIYITKAVIAWLQGMSNYGIMLKEKDDKYNNSFYTTEYSDPEKRLYVTVNYTDYADETAYTVGQGIVNESLYYIVNRETGKYLTAASGTTGTNITQQEFRTDYASTQQWQFTLDSTASYRISLGNTGLCIKNESNVLGGNLLLGNTGSTANQIWRLYRNWNGTYKIQSTLSTRGSIKVTSTNTNVFQHTYLCDFNFCDEWTLVPVQKQRASFFDFNINTTDKVNTTYGTGIMRSQSQVLGGYSIASRYTNDIPGRALTCLKNTSLFYYSGHGKPGQLNFYDSNGVSRGNLVVSDALIEDEDLDVSIESLTSNSLAQLQLAVLSSCDTGRDALLNGVYLDENMTGRLYWLGAHNVISHFHKTTQPYDITWTSAFMTSVLLGRTLKSAKQKADYNVYDDFRGDLNIPYGNLNERHDLGDDSYRAGFTPAHALAQRFYGYMDLPSLSFSLKESDSITDVIYDEETQNTVTMKFALPKDSIQDQFSDEEQHIYDVYLDSYGGIYWYYTGTDTLHSYEPFTEKLNLGESLVDPDDAMFWAEYFLNFLGYDVTEYAVETSNEYSKEYTILFYLPTNTAEKLVFHMQADEYGSTYITSFTAYDYNQ